MPKPLPPQTLLRELFDYNPRVGNLRWKEDRPPFIHRGDVAGSHLPDGHIRVTVGGVRFKAHRIIFVWMTGTCPDVVDHRDLNPSNNKWKNLRASTHSLNRANQRRGINNTSGFKGVSFHVVRKKFEATIKVNQKQKHLGYFETAAAAHQAYLVAAKKAFGVHSRLK